ncbi:cupin domain-containing protein [Kitasatospora sp. NPDC049285]|uniref:cupin domain-containing protein n=1 Tax=Kitasatospora sp. NPDC049285 TaxID=3157096 RepID=UPI00341718F8
MYPPVGDAPAAYKSHPGEEFLFVHAGRAEPAFPDRTVQLGPGDSVYVNSLVPHRLRSLDGRAAEVLLVIRDEPVAAEGRVPSLP